MSLKKRLICLMLLSVVLLCFSACKEGASSEESSLPTETDASMEEAAKNEPVQHMQYAYNLHFVYGHRNLTNPVPRAFDGGATSFALVKSAREFADLVSLDGTIGEFAEKNSLTEEDSYILEDELDWTILSQTGGFGLFTPDEAFFAEHNLLVVDICGGDGALRLSMTPCNLVITDGLAAVDAYWSGDFSSTADKAGRLCLIPLPKDCETAEVNFVYDSENSNHYNPFE